MLNKKGFTLIELLVAMGVMAVMMAISLVSYQGAKKAARDGKRKADLEQIRSALEIYRTDNRKYPNSTTSCLSSPWWNCWQNGLNGALQGYIEMPQDPAFWDSGGACSSGDTSRAYHYCTPDNGMTYVLSTRLETSSTPGTQTCGCNGFANYKVTNP